MSLAFGSVPWGKPCFPHVAPFFRLQGNLPVPPNPLPHHRVVPAR
jgi:hypothetical protein